MISDGEILSFIEDKIIVKDKNEKIVYSNIDNPLLFEQSLIVKGKFMLNENSCYTVSHTKRLAKDNNYYTITMYKPCKVNDYLTGVMTRGNFEDAMRGFLKKHSDFIIIIGDVDNFKMVNDTYGHRAGDQVLKSIGKILNSSLRNTDIVGRYGGEEFIICLLESDINNAYKIVERIRNKIQNTIIKVDDKMFKVTMTFGLSSYNAQKEYEEVIEEADKALYDGKANGRNQTLIYKSKQKSMKVNP